MVKVKTMINDDDTFYENTNGCTIQLSGWYIDEALGSAFETNNDVELSLTCVNQQPPFQ